MLLKPDQLLTRTFKSFLAAMLLVCAPLCFAGVQGWAVHYYGSAGFWYHAGETEIAGSDLAVDLNNVKWPAQNWDAAKGPLFVRSGGWSVAAYANLKLEKPGDFRFSLEPQKGHFGIYLLQINGCLYDDADLKNPIALPAGELPIAVFVKPSENATNPDMNRIKLCLLWQAPGMAKLEPVPASAITHEPTDAQRVKIL